MQLKQRKRMTTCLAAATAVALAAVMFGAGAPLASAATRTVQITAGQDLFVAQNLGSIDVGDTITWKNNDTHNVVSAAIPVGATAWKSPIMDGAAATFSQTVTAPGNYRYYCTLHASLTDANAATQSTSKMVGQFTVAAAPVVPVVVPPVVTADPPVVTADPPVVTADPPVVTADPTVVTADPTVVTADPTVDPPVAPVVPAAATPRAAAVVPGQDLFAPQNLGNINAGDTITWTNESQHNVVSTQIPVGATAFKSPIMSGAETFTLTPTVPGNYRYYCSLHSDIAAANAATQSTSEMVGQFTVGAATAPPVVTVDPPVVTVDPPVVTVDPPVVTVDPTVDPPVDPTVDPGTPVVPAAGTPSFRVDIVKGYNGRRGHRGGELYVLAQAGRYGHNGHSGRNGVRGKTVTASAVAHFSTGDVTAQMSRAGRNLTCMGKIVIPAGQTASTITVDVTVIYDGVTQPVISKTVRVKQFTKSRE